MYGMSKSHKSQGELLLDWLVGRGGGSTRVLEDTLRWICRGPDNVTNGLRTFFWAREMEALGYLEVDRLNGVWALSPAAAVTLPGPVGMIYLTGGVSQARLQQIDDALSRARMVNPCIELVARDPVGGIPLPSAAFVVPSSGDTLGEVVRVLQDILGYSPLAGPAVAARLPSIHDPMSKCAPPAAGSEVEQLIPEAVSEAYGGSAMWRPVQWWNAEELQLYKWRTPRVRYAIFRDGDWWSTGRDEGIYRLLGPQIDVRFHEEPGTGVGHLKVPVRAQLPAPQERAAVLCSGLGPQRSDLVAAYTNVPLDVATRIARTLGLELRIVHG